MEFALLIVNHEERYASHIQCIGKRTVSIMPLIAVHIQCLHLLEPRLFLLIDGDREEYYVRILHLFLKLLEMRHFFTAWYAP